jgi:hypothetical protein
MKRITIENSYPSLIVEKVDVESEWFFLSQFQTYRKDKEVEHVSDETV